MPISRVCAIVTIASLATMLLLSACGSSSARIGQAVFGGDAQRGKAAILRYGSGSCHSISGIRSAHGLVGPPLTGLRDRMYVAGVLPNTPDSVIDWIHDPKAVNSNTLMPTLGVTKNEATDIVAYIYSIR